MDDKTQTEFARRARNAETRQNLLTALLVMVFVSNIMFGLLVLNVVSSYREGVWVIADAQFPTGFQTQLEKDGLKRVLVVQGPKAGDPKELLERTRAALHAIAEN